MTQHAGDKHHPENPDRVRTINDHLTRSGLLNEALVLPSRVASVDEISLAHNRGLVEKVLSFTEDPNLIGGPETSDDPLVKRKQYLFPFDHDTYVCHSSPLAAQTACGCVLNVLDEIFSTLSECNRGFAAIRPPGHHACWDKSMGFCLFNNVAVGAAYAKKKFGLNRVAIIDWDVHHGNGTSDIFYENPDVLVLSVHRYDKGKFYPGTGHLADTGKDGGKGFNINVPIDGSYGDDEILYVWRNVVLPAMSDFKPELVLVSAGFDAAEHDPLGQCRVGCGTYGLLVKELLDVLNGPILGPITQGRLALVLEGGYNLKSIAAASVACMKALLQSDLSSGISSPASSFSDTSSTVSSVRSVPGGVPKTSVVRMVHELRKLLDQSGGVKIPITSPMVAKSKAPRIPELTGPRDFLLTSGGGHIDGVTRFNPNCVVKKTTVREALCYALIAEACGEELKVDLMSASVDWKSLINEEKRRVDFHAKRESFKAVRAVTCRCERVQIFSDTEAHVVIEDMTAGLKADESFGVLDIKLGTQYWTPEDGSDRIQTRRMKAVHTSAGTLGIRLTACKCFDGFSVGKHKARKMKLMEQLVAVFRRFIYSGVEAFADLVAEGSRFSNELVEKFESKTIDLEFFASSVLFVIGKRIDNNELELRCKLIDLAHLFEPQVESREGLLLGCRNLVVLFEQALEPSYESA